MCGEVTANGSMSPGARLVERMMNVSSEQPADEPAYRAGASSGLGASGLSSDGIDPLDRDLLISRVVDGVAGDADWSALDVLARADSAIWRDLAQAQRCNSDLTHAVNMAIVGADSVQLLDESVYPVVGSTSRGTGGGSFDLQSRAQSRFNAMARWTGWAAAAALALAWVSGIRTGNLEAGTHGLVNPPSSLATASPSLPESASDLLQRYLRQGQESGQVVAEMPSKLMLEAIPMDDKSGGYEVYFVRQIVERTRVPNLYTFTEGESGQLQPVQARISAPKRSGSY